MKSNISCAMILNVLLLLISTVVVQAEKLEFSHTLGSLATQCFSENLQEAVQVVVEVKTESSQLAYSIADPKGKKLTSQKFDTEWRYHFAAYYSGQHQICIENTSQKSQTYKFIIQTGVQATDYTSVVQKKHLKPVELSAQKVADMVEQIRTELGGLVVYEETIQESNSKIKSRVVVFGCISVLVMAISTVAQVSYLKSFFRNKKII